MSRQLTANSTQDRLTGCAEECGSFTHPTCGRGHCHFKYETDVVPPSSEDLGTLVLPGTLSLSMPPRKRPRQATVDPMHASANKSARACSANGETSTSRAAPSDDDLDAVAVAWKAAARSAFAAVTITGACHASEGAPLRLTERVCANLSTRAGRTVDLTTLQLLALVDPQFVSVSYGRDATTDPYEKNGVEEWLLRLQFLPEQPGKASKQKACGAGFKPTKRPQNLQLLVAQRLQSFEAKVDAFIRRLRHGGLALPPLSGQPSIEPIAAQKLSAWDDRPVTVLNLLEYLQSLEGCGCRICPAVPVAPPPPPLRSPETSEPTSHA